MCVSKATSGKVSGTSRTSGRAALARRKALLHRRRQDPLTDVQQFARQTYERATGRRLDSPWLPTSDPQEIQIFRDQLPPRPTDRPQLILVTGITGTSKRAFADAVAKIGRERYGQDIAVVHVGDQMYTHGPDILPGRVLFTPPQRLAELRRAAMEEVQAQLEAGRHVIVNTHATFWWHNGVFLAFGDGDVEFWRAHPPNRVVEVVDNLYTVHHRIVSEHHYRAQLSEVVAWRGRESATSQTMAAFLAGSMSHFMVGRGRTPKEFTQSVDAVAKDLFGPIDLLRAYLTIPMTHVFDDPEVMAEIQKYGDALCKRIIALLPQFVDEFLWTTAAEQAFAAGKPEFAYPTFPGSDQKLVFSSAEVAMLAQLVEGEIVSRDLKLIRQVWALIGYMAKISQTGKPAISAGQQKEIDTAMQWSLYIYLCYVSSRKPSPFDQKFGDIMVATFKQLLQILPTKVTIIDRPERMKKRSRSKRQVSSPVSR